MFGGGSVVCPYDPDTRAQDENRASEPDKQNNSQRPHFIRAPELLTVRGLHAVATNAR